MVYNGYCSSPLSFLHLINLIAINRLLAISKEIIQCFKVEKSRQKIVLFELKAVLRGKGSKWSECKANLVKSPNFPTLRGNFSRVCCCNRVRKFPWPHAACSAARNKNGWHLWSAHFSQRKHRLGCLGRCRCRCRGRGRVVFRLLVVSAVALFR